MLSFYCNWIPQARAISSKKSSLVILTWISCPGTSPILPDLSSLHSFYSQMHFSVVCLEHSILLQSGDHYFPFIVLPANINDYISKKSHIYYI